MLAALLLAIGLWSASTSVLGREDHERARQALLAGEVLPLKVILERVEIAFPGKVIDVELEREGHDDRKPWIYELKVLQAGGSLIKVKVDAKGGQILSGRPHRSRPDERLRHERSLHGIER